MRPRDVAAALAVMVIWGVNFVVAKLALEEFPPIILMALRFALVAVLIVPFVRFPRGRMRGVLVFSVLLGTIHFPLMFMGLTGIDAATASIAIQLQVPFSSLLAAAVFGDRLGWRRAAGMAVAFAGVVVIAGEPRMSGNVGSLLLVVAASFAFAVVSIHIKRMGPMDGFVLNGWMALLATPQLLAISLLIEQDQLGAIMRASWVGWACIAYMAVLVTVVAYGLWYPLLRRYDVNQTMPWTLTVPVFGVASSVAFLGDPLTPGLIAGGLLTVAGVAVILVPRPRGIVPPAGNPT